MRFFILAILTALSLHCAAQDYKTASSELYGYTADMPIPMKAKGRLKSLHKAERFIKHLRRDNGEQLIYLGRGSMRDPNYQKQDGVMQPVGKSGISMLRVHDFGGWLDVFSLAGAQRKDTFQLYVNIYSEGEAQVPRGLKYEGQKREE